MHKAGILEFEYLLLMDLPETRLMSTYIKKHFCLKMNSVTYVNLNMLSVIKVMTKKISHLDQSHLQFIRIKLQEQRKKFTILIGVICIKFNVKNI